MPLKRHIVGLNMFAICAFMEAVLWVHMNGHRAAQNAEARPLSEAGLIVQTIVAELTMRRQNADAQSLNQSLGATLSDVKLSKDLVIGFSAPDLEQRHRQVLENYPQIFVVLTLAILVFSVRLATTISAPISSLAAAVEASGTTEWKNEAKPRALILDLSQLSDEIGRLSAALRGMVAALYDRIYANEKFVGEVAHEIKNPLASLRAAVGAFAIAKSGPERQ